MYTVVLGNHPFYSVSDQGFPTLWVGGGDNTKGGEAKILFWPIISKNNVKWKKLDQEGGTQDPRTSKFFDNRLTPNLWGWRPRLKNPRSATRRFWLFYDNLLANPVADPEFPSRMVLTHYLAIFWPKTP